MPNAIRPGQAPQSNLQHPEVPAGAELKRGSRTLRQADAKTLGRGNARATAKQTEGAKKGGIKQFFKGAKLAITGGAQTAAYERVARTAAGWASIDKAEAKATKTRAKADDGRALMLSALRGTKVDPRTAASVQARDARNAGKAAAKAARAAARVAKFEQQD